MNESSGKIVAVGHRRSWSCCRAYRSLLNFLVSEFASSSTQIFSNIVACQRRRLSKQLTKRRTADWPADGLQGSGALTAFQAKPRRFDPKLEYCAHVLRPETYLIAQDASKTHGGCAPSGGTLIVKLDQAVVWVMHRESVGVPIVGSVDTADCLLAPPSQDACSRFVGDLSISRRGDVMDPPLRWKGMARCQAMSGEILSGRERVRQPEECQDESGQQR